jgi:hypothetical protein
MSLSELPIDDLAYVVEAGDWAVVAASQEGETVAKRNFLDYKIFSTDSSYQPAYCSKTLL